MAVIGTVTLKITVDTGNVVVNVTYPLGGSMFDINTGQPYREQVKLVGDDTGIVPAEDGVDNDIVGGLIADTTVVFSGPSPISRNWTKTLLKTALNEDNPGTDEIRAVVTLTPIPAQARSKESNQVTGNFANQ